jgi:hypothetical protein
MESGVPVRRLRESGAEDGDEGRELAGELGAEHDGAGTTAPALSRTIPESTCVNLPIDGQSEPKHGDDGSKNSRSTPVNSHHALEDQAHKYSSGGAAAGPSFPQ